MIVTEKLGLQATSRLKTVNTIIEKLKRERTRLSTIQDIAGLRLVKDMNLTEQDEISRIIAEIFLGAKLVDRREQPSHGYRAVHVIVPSGECPVEIQVRTALQDLWAQAMEKVADAIGREIRYGVPPANDAHRSTVEMLMKMSGMIANLEQLIVQVSESETAADRTTSHSTEYQSQKTRLAVIRSEVRQLLEELKVPGVQK